MFKFTIHGARYAVLGENVYFDINEIELPVGIPPSELVIKWYKNDVSIPQYEWESQTRLDLYDVGYPAEGNYSAVATAGEYVAHSNSIYLEIGTELRQCSVDIKSRRFVEANIGDSISFAPVCTTVPDYAHRECVWYHNNKALGPDEYIDVKVEDLSDYGDYELRTHVWAHGGYKPANVETILTIIPSKDTTCPSIYLHDLNGGPLGGGRNKGYIWVGYWVIDEIIDAIIEGFDWMADPHNSRFKYKCEIARLADGFNQYPDLEVQESRNGYILGRHDLI